MNKKWPIITLAVVCLSLVGGGIYLFLDKNKCYENLSKLGELSTNCVNEVKDLGLDKEILPTQDQNQPKKPKLPTLAKEFCSEMTKTCIKYPEDWTVRVSEPGFNFDDFKANQSIHFLNNEKVPAVSMVDRVSGLGGPACSEGEHFLKRGILESKEVGLKDRDGKPFRVVKMYHSKLTPGRSRSVTAYVGLALADFQASDEREIDACPGMYFYQFLSDSNDTISMVGGERDFENVEDAKAWLQSAENDLAFEVLSSVYRK